MINNSLIIPLPSESETSAESRSANPVTVALIDVAYEILISNLRNYANALSEKHRRALFELIVHYGLLIDGSRQGRLVFGIDTGMGKTESIVALVTAIHRLNLVDVSVLVCQGKVEGLCELKRKMIAMGVPEEKVGLIHSYAFDPSKLDVKGKPLEEGFASMPSTPLDEQRQFQLVTHSRVKGKTNISKYNAYMDKPRSLVIWDESLLASDVKSIHGKEMIKAIHSLSIDYNDNSKYEGLIAYLKNVEAIVESELNSQKAGNSATKIKFDEIGEEKQKVYAEIIKQLRGSHHYKEVLVVLMGVISSEVRVLNTKDGWCIAHYNIVIPNELDKVIILDASWWIRELQQLDSSIEDISLFAEGVKRYDHVTIHQMQVSGSRYNLNNDFSLSPTKRKITKELAAVIKSIPDTEGVIIFTYKHRQGEPDFIKIMKKDLVSQGINVEQTIQITQQGELKDKPRFNFLTWGSETSLNEYSYCSNVILIGILHRSHLELGASLLAQHNDLEKEIDHRSIKAIHDSEIAHLAFQALSRGICRQVDNGYAKSMKAWIIHKDLDIKKRLEKVMPGVKCVSWEEVVGNNKGIISSIAFHLQVLLLDQPEDRDRIATSKLRQELNYEVKDSTWTKALKLTLEKTESWKLEGRSVIRVSEYDLLFPDQE